ncbi:MAG: molybdate ABC transporter substrate-binding protein [Pseudomonadota bacterium]
MPISALTRTALRKLRLRAPFAAAVLVIATMGQAAAPARVAVATNFAGPLELLKGDFEQATGYRLLVSAGSTGKLYAQIVRGAPFDLFLAADQARPRRLAAEQLAVGEPFVYARGQLVLWTRQPGQSAALLRSRLEAGAGRLSIANEKLAPYGLAAKQVLTSLGLWEQVQPRLLRGENVGQAYALAATGNAPLALIAASMVRSPDAGSQWVPPAETHAPVLQAAVRLKGGAGSEAASAFARFLRSPAVQARLEGMGYLAPLAAEP